MKFSETLAAYADIRQVLDMALAQGGLRTTHKNKAAAITWRHRAYKFRRKFLDWTAASLERQGVHAIPSTPYDLMRLVITPENPLVVEIYPDRQQIVMTDMKGNPIEAANLPSVSVHTPTELDEEIRKVAEGLDIGNLEI